MRFALALVLGLVCFADTAPVFPVRSGSGGGRGLERKARGAGRVAETQRTTAMVVVAGGRVIFEYGDTKLVSKVASVRKSILAMLYGVPEVQERLDLNKTVVELGVEDVQPFLASEKNATVMHLLTARSGIYHPSGNDELTSRSPRRGAQTPGLYFQYQNWDFNAAGTAFEKLSGKDIYDAL
jgi:CubicO group peptidase (beta-lactamase class C family)